MAGFQHYGTVRADRAFVAGKKMERNSEVGRRNSEIRNKVEVTKKRISIFQTLNLLSPRSLIKCGRPLAIMPEAGFLE